MTLRLAIIHMDMVIETLPLEPGEYSLGRSKDCNIVVQHFSLHRQQGKIFYEQEQWFYQDARTQKKRPIGSMESVELSEHISIASQEYVENENTHINDYASLSAQHKGGFAKAFALGWRHCCCSIYPFTWHLSNF